MKRVKSVLAVLAVALLVLTTALVATIAGRVSQQREPVYQGKPLSEWLKPYAYQPWRNYHEANEAVRHIGTNAIPTLLRLVRINDSDLKARLMAFAQRQHIIKVEYIPAQGWHSAAGAAFGVLGTKGQSAVPGLLEILNQDLSLDSDVCAVYALSAIGPPAQQAVPALLRYVTNANVNLRRASVQALGAIHADPDKVVPVLIGAMHDRDPYVQREAICALERFGPSAKLAVPALVELVVPPAGFVVPPARFVAPSIGTVTNPGPGIDAATKAYIAAVIAGTDARDQWLHANLYPTRLHAARALEVIDPAAASRAERSWTKLAIDGAKQIDVDGAKP